MGSFYKFLDKSFGNQAKESYSKSGVQFLEHFCAR